MTCPYKKQAEAGGKNCMCDACSAERRGSVTQLVREKRRWKATQWHKMGDHPQVVNRGDYKGIFTEGAGWTMVWPGDWILEDERLRRFYAVRPDTFVLLYEPVA